MSGGAVVLREPVGGDLSWLAWRHMQTVAVEFGWDRRFEGHVAQLIGHGLLNFDPARERFWVADRDGQLLGCIGIAAESGEVARLRMLFVEPAARGMGLGHQLVDACLAFAREAGYREIVLWTFSVLEGARRIYVEKGFVLESSQPWDGVGPVLQDESWRLKL